jgi:SAM-dependent methyltransferase
VQYYVGLAQRYGGPVLEYGAGNGRIALPIARHGVEITGVDHSGPMLADFRRRLREEPEEVRQRVRLLKGDMRKTRITGRKKFQLVLCTFNTALHLYERRDVEAFLARVREHLAPGGLFVVDLSIPSMADLLRDPAKAYKAPSFKHPSAGHVGYEEHFDYDPVRQICFVLMEFLPRDKSVPSFATPLAHRQFFPREWEALLTYNGFDVERVFGDFHGGPLDRNSDVMVWHARVRRGKKKA